MGSVIAVIIAAGIGLGISYLPSVNTTSVSNPNIASHQFSIDYVSLRASPSTKFYPTLWSSIYTGSPLLHLNASIDGNQVYSEPLSQENVSYFHEQVSIEIKNTNLAIDVGKNYNVSFIATYEDGERQTVSILVVALPPSTSNVTVNGVELCVSDCVYPSPYLSAMINVNATTPLSSVVAFINGTSVGAQSYSDNNITQYEIVFKTTWRQSGQTNIVSGQAYNVTFVAEFGDGTVSTANLVINAT
jgi:hypothetical protein